MDVIRMIITIFLMLVSIALVVVVMMQKSKEGGMGALFGSDAGSTLSAKGQSASKEAKLQKITIILASIIGFLALVMVALPAS